MATTPDVESRVLESSPSADVVPPAASPDGDANAPDRRSARDYGKRPRLRLVVRAVVALLGLAVVIWLGLQYVRTSQAPASVRASGVLEASEVLLASELGGRVKDLPLREGNRVAVGSVVVTFDDARLVRALEVAERISSDPQNLAGVSSLLGLEIDPNNYYIRSPIDGVVSRIPVHIGEVTRPGQTLATVTDPRQLDGIVYVRLRDIGGVRVGQPVMVTADPSPGESFFGSVSTIRDQAEYTPRNVQAERDRLNLVFAVRIRVDNRGTLLKAGMPIQVTFLPG